VRIARAVAGEGGERLLRGGELDRVLPGLDLPQVREDELLFAEIESAFSCRGR
jgi:hypothetical protein